MANPDVTGSQASDTDESVWTFRGYKMNHGQFNTAMVHLYRGEVSRANVWRRRLDNTTNWAVVTTAGILTFSFGSTNNPHVILLLAMLMVCLFMILEARRYRYYELWSLRVRLLETDFFAAMLGPPFAPHKEWATRLTESLLTPEFPISFSEAIGRRLRRNFIWLFLVLGLAWLIKLELHPAPAYSLDAFINNARVGTLPGIVVITFVALFFITIFTVALVTVGLRQSAGEVLPRHEVLNLPGELLHNLADAASSVLSNDLRLTHRHEHLAIIITEKAEDVSQQLLKLLNRGVTCLEGKGMYSGTSRAVLLCAISPTETDHLKSAVYAADEDAFVMVNATEEILGGGFGQLEPRWRQGSHTPNS